MSKKGRVAGEMSEIIYVYLPNEAVDVWAPVDAEHVRDDLYRIPDCRGGRRSRVRHRLSGKV